MVLPGDDDAPSVPALPDQRLLQQVALALELRGLTAGRHHERGHRAFGDVTQRRRGSFPSGHAAAEEPLEEGLVRAKGIRLFIGEVVASTADQRETTERFALPSVLGERRIREPDPRRKPRPGGMASDEDRL